MHGSPSEVTPISLRSTRVVTGNCNNATSEMSHDQHYWQQRTATRNTLSSSSSFLFFCPFSLLRLLFFLLLLLQSFRSGKCPSTRKGTTFLALHMDTTPACHLLYLSVARLDANLSGMHVCGKTESHFLRVVEIPAHPDLSKSMHQRP